MCEQKSDRRIRKTNMAIFRALESLTQKKPLEEITVTAVCQEADISRQAFYSRYRDPLHAVESYIESIYAQGLEIPIPYETSEKRKEKLQRLWADNRPALKLILVTSRSQRMFDLFVDMVARLYVELNKVPRAGIPAADSDPVNTAMERNLAMIRANMLKHQIETDSDGAYEEKVMAQFWETVRKFR